jgi:IS5 family transposase
MKQRGHTVSADKPYSGHVLRNELKNKSIKTVISRKATRKWHRMIVQSSIVMHTAIETLSNVASIA